MGTLPKNGPPTVEANATPEQVWTLLTDITRAGEWSHETQGGEWLDGATGRRARAPASAAATSNGRIEVDRGSARCVAADAPALDQLAHRARPALYRDSTIWTYELEPTDAGLPHHAALRGACKLGPFIDRLFYAIDPGPPRPLRGADGRPRPPRRGGGHPGGDTTA